MTCSRPWHNLAGRTGIRAQAFMPHTSLLHIVLSLRLRNQEGFGNRFPTYFMLACLDLVSEWKLVHTVWALLKAVQSSAGFELSSKFTPSSAIFHVSAITILVLMPLPWGLVKTFRTLTHKRCYVNLKIMPLLVLYPFHSGLFDITMIVMIIIIIGISMNIFLCYQFYSLSNRLVTKWIYVCRKAKQK